MKSQSLSIFYDGKCPVCSRYVRYLRLSEGNTAVLLMDLRDHPEKVAEFNALGFNVDDGMIVALDDQTYHGAEAVHVLALLSTTSSFFNRCNRWVFSRRWLANLLYPILVSGRNLLLILLGQKKLLPDNR